MAKIVYIVTEWTAADWHLRDQLGHVRSLGHEVTLITHGPPHRLEALRQREGVEVIDVPMSREIDPIADGAALVRLVALISSLDPDIVHASTPKAGLLGMIAAAMNRVPSRIYMLRGLRLETTSGLKRSILWQCERMSMACAHEVVCVSSSLRERAIELGLLAPGEGRILGNGSSNGLDPKRFELADEDRPNLEALRASLGLDGREVIGFVGRLTKDKGVDVLIEAFTELAQHRDDLSLLLVGDFEPGDPVSSKWKNMCDEDPRIVQTGFVVDPEPYYHLMDIFAFTSFREGMPNVPLQAAASGLPVVAFDATGTRDALVDRKTGFLVEPGGKEGLKYALEAYIDSPLLRQEHGEQGRAWVSQTFSKKKVYTELMALFDAMGEERRSE